MLGELKDKRQISYRSSGQGILEAYYTLHKYLLVIFY